MHDWEGKTLQNFANSIVSLFEHLLSRMNFHYTQSSQSLEVVPSHRHLAVLHIVSSVLRTQHVRT